MTQSAQTTRSPRLLSPDSWSERSVAERARGLESACAAAMQIIASTPRDASASPASIRFLRPPFASFEVWPLATMPERLTTAAELARQVADALERARIPYAIGGAIALAYYAPPRATVDVDLNVFVPPAQGLSRVIGVLAEVGFAPDESLDALQRRAETDGQFRGRAQGLRVARSRRSDRSPDSSRLPLALPGLDASCVNDPQFSELSVQSV